MVQLLASLMRRYTVQVDFNTKYQITELIGRGSQGKVLHAIRYR